MWETLIGLGNNSECFLFTDYLHKYIKYKNKYINLKNIERNKKNELIGGSKINFEKVKIIKTLGAGMYGTTYLVNYKDKKYAMKIQHILEKDIKKDYKNEIWRELDLYNYINKLNKEDQRFFTKLYDFEIIDNCNHNQERPFNIDSIQDNNFIKKLQTLDKSKVCVKYLLDYKGNINLDNFLTKHKITEKQILSLCLQICKIIYVLYQGGYSHNDLHPGNIMINKTNKKYFNFMNKKICYKGYQLTSIDYGEVLHKKFKIKYKDYKKEFLNNRKYWLFRECFYCIMNVLDNSSKNIFDCNRLKQILPFERKENVNEIAIIKMITKYNDFYKKVKDKYIKIFPKGEKLLNLVESKIIFDCFSKEKSLILGSNGKINEIVKRKKNEKYFWDILNRIVYEFQITYPKKYLKYWKWCSLNKVLLKNNIIIELLLANNYNNLINIIFNNLKDK